MLTWKWDNSIGNCIIKQDEKEWEITLYKGNALLIGLYRYTDKDGQKMYNMQFFFCDKEHLKNLDKDDSFWKEFKEFTFYKFDSDISAICKVLAKHKIKIIIDTADPF